LVGKLSGNQCSGRFSGPPVNTLEQVRTGVGSQSDAGVPEPLRDHPKGHGDGDLDFSNAELSGSTITFTKATFSRGDVDFSDAEFSGGTVDFGPPATGIQDQPLIGQTPCPMA
jgi:Pentapeptide repeats (9 copies)